MKIAIVGTSNSILKDGWVKYYRELVQDVEIDNYSLGSNSSLYGHYILEKKDILDKYDYCFIDFAVNDQHFFDKGLISEELLVASYLDFIRKFRNSNCIPIFLILPIVEYCRENSKISTIRQNMIALCDDFGVM